VFICRPSLGSALSIRSGLCSDTEEDLKGDSPALTIYNQQFAVVRQKLPLDLRSGVSHVQVTDITAHLEPDSVILRSLDTGRRLQILEQNYRNDPVSQQLLLSLYEGKTIDFQDTDKDGSPRSIQGKIIRSGYVPHYTAFQSYGPQYAAQQTAVAQGSEQPLIEVNGKLQFSLPGQPLFPALADDTVLKPTLSWELLADKPGATPAEFSYVTGGMNWEASYNVIAPPKSNVLELVGWVTLDNQSGKTFRDARLKLMAGDVNKVPPPGLVTSTSAGGVAFGMGGGQFGPPVTEKTFDEYHLYTLGHPTTLHDRETKQVEMVRATGIQSKTVYVYDGFKVDQNYQNWPLESIRQQESYGILSNPKVGSCRSSRTAQTIISACLSPKVASVSIAATTTANSNSPVKTLSTTLLRTKPSTSILATPSTWPESAPALNTSPISMPAGSTNHLKSRCAITRVSLSKFASLSISTAGRVGTSSRIPIPSRSSIAAQWSSPCRFHLTVKKQ
jgi:hypothetical protein